MHFTIVRDNIKRLVSRGAYEEAIRYISLLPDELRTHPETLLEKSRCFLRQGVVVAAEETLASLKTSSLEHGIALIISLEKAFLLIYRYFNFDEAFALATKAFEEAKGLPITEGNFAEARRVYIRMQITAAVYKMVTAAQEQESISQLPQIAQTLSEHGRIDESLAALLTFADRQSDLQIRKKELTEFVQVCLKSGRADLAAEGLILVAQQMLKEGDSEEAIEAILRDAWQLYQEIEHMHGLIDVQYVRACVSLQRKATGAEILNDCLAEYRQCSYYKGIIKILIDLSQLAHEKGDIQLAIEYRGEIIRLSDELGMGLTRDSSMAAQVDLLIRRGRYGDAIELAKAAIESKMPVFSKAGYEILLSSAYTFINFLKAVEHGRKGVALYESLGEADIASDSVVKLASDLVSLGSNASIKEGEKLIEDWMPKDIDRMDYAAVVSKLEIKTQAKLALVKNASPTERNVLIQEAHNTIIKAETFAKTLSGKDAVLRLGSLAQMKGQIYTSNDDEEGMLNAWKEAAAIYSKAGYFIYAANCNYLIGVLYMNRAGRVLLPNFVDAENKLKIALEYYESAGMRQQAADTRFMLASLYFKAHFATNTDLANQLLGAAIGLLIDAQADYDNMRREFVAGDGIEEVQGGKYSFIKNSRRIFGLALQILCSVKAQPIQAWEWTQQAKARALSDMLGISTVIPHRIIAALQHDDDSLTLIKEERALIGRIAMAGLEEKISFRSELNGLWEKMGEFPALSEYLQLRRNVTATLENLDSLFDDIKAAGKNYVCVDWVSVNDLLYMIVVRAGKQVLIEPLPVPLSKVSAFVNLYFSQESFRSNLRDMPEVLREMDFLIRPLLWLSAPDDLLILSPTGLLFTIPLHALEIDSQVLLERNPVVYVPSLSILQLCISRRKPRITNPAVVLFGDPNSDRDATATLVNNLADLFHVPPFLKEQVTVATFLANSTNKDIIHFQGHAVHDFTDPLQSYLSLAECKLTARDVFELDDLGGATVTLGACESAVNLVAIGDEPMGLIPAFLYAGATSVLATLWKVNQYSASFVMQKFYHIFLQSTSPLRKAEAIRQAMLAVRKEPGFESPYHWAPFVLFGDWQ